MRAKTAITANTAQKKEGCVAFANDDFENARRVKYHWEIIAENLKKAGWSLGYVSAIDSEGGTIWIADAHRGDGKRFIVRADEKLTAFLELESAIRLVRQLISINETDARNCTGLVTSSLIRGRTLQLCAGVRFRRRLCWSGGIIRLYATKNSPAVDLGARLYCH
jgi:hypothetical protein